MTAPALDAIALSEVGGVYEACVAEGPKLNRSNNKQNINVILNLNLITNTRH